MQEEDVVRVKATPEAVELIALLRGEHGEVLFHQSGGCCDGSAPMCYPTGDYMVGDDDVHLGTIGGARGLYFQLAVRILAAHAADHRRGAGPRWHVLSLENGSGKRFLTRGRVFTDEEVAAMKPAVRYGKVQAPVAAH